MFFTLPHVRARGWPLTTLQYLHNQTLDPLQATYNVTHDPLQVLSAAQFAYLAPLADAEIEPCQALTEPDLLILVRRRVHAWGENHRRQPCSRSVNGARQPNLSLGVFADLGDKSSQRDMLPAASARTPFAEKSVKLEALDRHHWDVTDEPICPIRKKPQNCIVWQYFFARGLALEACIVLAW